MDVLVQDEGEKDGADDKVWSWCPVANVVDAHETGQDHHIMHGTKIFSAGTKVYISSEWADTRTIGGSFKVIGRAQKPSLGLRVAEMGSYGKCAHAQGVLSGSVEDYVQDEQADG